MSCISAVEHMLSTGRKGGREEGSTQETKSPDTCVHSLPPEMSTDKTLMLIVLVYVIYKSQAHILQYNIYTGSSAVNPTGKKFFPWCQHLNK